MRKLILTLFLFSNLAFASDHKANFLKGYSCPGANKAEIEVIFNKLDTVLAPLFNIKGTPKMVISKLSTAIISLESQGIDEGLIYKYTVSSSKDFFIVQDSVEQFLNNNMDVCENHIKDHDLERFEKCFINLKNSLFKLKDKDSNMLVQRLFYIQNGIFSMYLESIIELKKDFGYSAAKEELEIVAIEKVNDKLLNGMKLKELKEDKREYDKNIKIPKRHICEDNEADSLFLNSQLKKAQHTAAPFQN